MNHSFRFRIVLFVFLMTTSLLLIIIMNNVYAIHVVRNQVYESNLRILSIYMNQIDQAFDDLEKYLVGLQLSENIVIIETTESEVSYYTAQARMRKEIDNAIPSYRFIDSIFLFFSRDDLFIDSAKFTVDAKEQNRIRDMIRDYIGDSEHSWSSEGKWINLRNESGYYLVRILKIKDIYMGSCVSVSSLRENLAVSDKDIMEALTFCDRSGYELGTLLPEHVLFNPDIERISMVGDNREYLLLSAPSRKGDFSMVSLIRDSHILEGLDSIQRMITFLIAAVVLFLILFFFMVKRWLLKPLNNLVRAMQSLGEGNLDIRLNGKEVLFNEFLLVNETFDQMIGQIRDLKIDVYEERHLRQISELQYMKLQMNPHYYINCLNTIYNLSVVGKDDLIQEITTSLGDQLRYTMEGHSLVPLRKEIAYVENYLHIQTLRYAECIDCHYDIDADTLDILVPPLIIQTFVENTVKHQIVVGEITELWIRIFRDRELMHIRIWDSGDGFSEEILDRIRSKERIFYNEREHYGIYNVWQRLQLIFPSEADLSIANHNLTGGAYIRITVPIRGAGEGYTDERTDS